MLTCQMADRIRLRRFAWFVVHAIVALAVGVVHAQEPVDIEKNELDDLLKSARNYEIQMKKPDVLLKLREPPVLNFTNPERNQERGSVFVWMQDSRPAVIGQFFCFNSPSGRLTKHAVHSLVQVPLEAKANEIVAWAPDQAGIEWKSLTDAPEVGNSRVNRLLQMRQLARRFELTLISPQDKKTELRLAPRPLFEYSAPKSGVTDGVILSYVVATDPEAILLLEAFDEQGQTGFRYAFARFHFWKLTATDGDHLVWEVAHDPTMSGNRIANPETFKKVYNSFHP